MSTSRTSAEIRAELEAAQAEYTQLGSELVELRREQAALEARRMARETRRTYLAGERRGSGEIARLIAQLEQAERIESDATKPRIQIGTEEHVVVKVTAARIFTRRPGASTSMTWQLDGRPVARTFSWSPRIPADVAAQIVADAAKGGVA